MKPDLSSNRSEQKKPSFLLSSKFIAIQFVVLVLSSVFAFAVFSHPGRTDSNGGHYNRSTGEYHYHHGYPAHQHKDGVCPYDYDDKTASKSSSTVSEKSTTEEQHALMPTKSRATESTTAANSTKTSTHSTDLLNDPDFWLYVIGAVICLYILAMPVVICLKSKKSKNALDSYKHSLSQKAIEIESLKEDLRLKELECKDIRSENSTLQMKCNLYRARANYLFVTKHLKDNEYERYYLDMFEKVGKFALSPPDTMAEIAPMVADYLLISIKQTENELGESKSGADQNRAVKIADIRKETKEILSKYIQNQYKLEYLLCVFPELNYFIAADTSYRDEDIYMQTRKNIAKALPNLGTPIKTRWCVFFDICMHYIFEFGSLSVYEMIYQKLNLEIAQMEVENPKSIWDLDLQISSLSLLIGISTQLLKTATSLCENNPNEIRTALFDFAKKCLLEQLNQGGITQDVFDSLLNDLKNE